MSILTPLYYEIKGNYLNYYINKMFIVTLGSCIAPWMEDIGIRNSVVVVELVVVVAVVVEVEVAVVGGVPFGHPRPPQMSTIMSITLSDKVVVLKKKSLSIMLC
jgi:hypothetical protein